MGVSKYFNKSFITFLIIALALVISFNGKLLAEGLFDDNTFTPEKFSGRYFKMIGIIKEMNNYELKSHKNIENAEITILNEEHKVIGVTRSNKIGKCILKLPLNRQFVVMVSKKGWITKTIYVDTRLSNEKFKQYYINYEIEMFEEIQGLDVSLLKKPVAHIKYNNHLKWFDYDFKYTDQVNNKIRKSYLCYYKLHPESKSRLSSNPVKKEKNKNNSNRVKYVPSNISKLNPSLSTGRISDNEQHMDTGVSERKNSKSEIDSVLYSQNSHRDLLLDKSPNDSLYNSSDIVFKIQVLVLDKYLSPDAEFFKKCGKAEVSIYNGKYKYTLGEFKNIDDASKLLNVLNSNGYNDAFIISLFKDKRISVSKAILIQNNSK